MTPHLFMLKATMTDPEAWTNPALRIYEHKGQIVWHLEYKDWTWRDRDPSVREFERIYRVSEERSCDPGTEGLSGYFWRLGEEDGDIDQQCFGNTFGVDIVWAVSHAFSDYTP